MCRVQICSYEKRRILHCIPSRSLHLHKVRPRGNCVYTFSLVVNRHLLIKAHTHSKVIVLMAQSELIHCLIKHTLHHLYEAVFHFGGNISRILGGRTLRSHFEAMHVKKMLHTALCSSELSFLMIPSATALLVATSVTIVEN